MCLTLSDYDRDTRCETAWCVDRSSCWIQASFWRGQFREFSRIHHILMGIANPFIYAPERHIHGTHKPVNLNRFLRNIPVLEIFRKSESLINRYSWDSVLVIDDTILHRKGKHIDGSGWVFDHSEGKSVLGMQYVTAVVSGREGIFPLNLDLKTKNGLS